MRRRIRLLPLTPWSVFLRASLICGLVGAVTFGLSLRKIEPLPLNGDPLQFNAQMAHAYMTQLAKGFPGRVTYTDARKRAGLWLKEELRKMGYSPRGMLFSEIIDGKQYTDLENIYAEKRGTKHPDEIIMAVAHYDITDTTVEGAMDDASGVGVVLELARVFSKLETDRTIVFLLTDSEEFGAFWGARSFVKSYEKADKIVAVANFDFVNPEDQVGILTLCSGLKEGYTPLWLRELALDSLRSLGARAMDLTNVVEHIERAILIPPADHGPFLAEGIPAFNWAGQTQNLTHMMTHYHHTQHDVAEAMKVESFENYGKGAERLIRSIDALAKIPVNFRDSSYWKITQRLYIEGWVVTLLHILAFIPFLAYSISRFGIVFRGYPKRRIWNVIQNEAKNMAMLLGALLLGYAVMLLLPALRIVTQYEAFPGTQKSLFLYSPNFIAIFLVIAAVIGVYWIFRRTFYEPEDDHDYAEIRHAFLAALIALITVLAFLKNSYLAVLLLLPPAYFWTAMSHRKRESRFLNVLLLLGGSITFVAVAIVMGTIFHIGAVYWFLFLSAAYGLISAYSVVLFLMALTVMIRLFRSFILK